MSTPIRRHSAKETIRLLEALKARNFKQLFQGKKLQAEFDHFVILAAQSHGGFLISMEAATTVEEGDPPEEKTYVGLVWVFYKIVGLRDKSKRVPLFPLPATLALTRVEVGIEPPVFILPHGKSLELMRVPPEEWRGYPIIRLPE